MKKQSLIQEPPAEAIQFPLRKFPLYSCASCNKTMYLAPLISNELYGVAPLHTMQNGEPCRNSFRLVRIKKVFGN